MHIINSNYPQSPQSPQSPVYRVSWTRHTKHLNHDPTLLSRIGKVFWLIISAVTIVIGLCRLAGYYIFAKQANQMALPAAYFDEKRKQEAVATFEDTWNTSELRKVFKKEDYRIETPDGIELSTILFRHNEATEKDPTIIFFCCSGQLKEDTPICLFLEKMKELNITGNCVIWDYRGVGQSQGRFEGTRDLVVDGTSIVEWVERFATTDPSNIHFYGLSLGGVISTLTQAHNPFWKGRIVNDRSFASSQAILQARLEKRVFSALMHSIFQIQGYSADPYAILAKKMEKDHDSVLVIANRTEEVIPYQASMAKAISKHWEHRVIHIQMKAKEELSEEQKKLFEKVQAVIGEKKTARYLPHAGPLPLFKNETGDPHVDEQVVRFLFGVT